MPILFDVAQNARYVTGRSSAVWGLNDALVNPDQTAQGRKKILALLKEISEHDRSGRLRFQAEFLYKKPPRKIRRRKA